MAGKGGGAWKVAYADFVTAMMAFFMVMWITAQSEQVKNAIAHHFSDPFGAKDRNGKSGGSEASGPPYNFKDSTRFSIRPQIKVDRKDPKEFQFGVTIYFTGTSTEIDEVTLGSLNAMIPYMRWNAPQIEIIGYAKSNLKETEGIDPWWLANQRCLVVKKFVEGLGMPMSKIKMSQGVSIANFVPTDLESITADEYANRVEIKIPPAEKAREVSDGAPLEDSPRDGSVPQSHVSEGS
jgi:chemotaxis protein MotB